MSWLRMALVVALVYGAEMIVGPQISHDLAICGVVVGTYAITVL